MDVRPIGAKVLVKPLPAESMTAGGIHIPDVAQGRDWKGAVLGEVIGVGDGYRISVSGERETLLPERVPLDVKKGDRVLYPKNVGEDVVIDGVECRIIHEEIVLGIIEDDETEETSKFLKI